MNFWKFLNLPAGTDKNIPPGKRGWDVRPELVKAAFGTDVNSIIYSPGFNAGLLAEIQTIYFGQHTAADSMIPDFKNRSPLNIPGPVYTCETDNCGTGQPEAPSNILCDEMGREHVFIQPRTFDELLNIIRAAWIEPFDSYGFDGNQNWTKQLVREWWGNRNDLMEQLRREEMDVCNQRQNRNYIVYLTSLAKPYLMRYCHFLETGIYPASGESVLPEID
jgi:hypothetical protein